MERRPLERLSEWIGKSDLIRKDVESFAQAMETVLRQNEHKGGYDEADPLWFVAKLQEECGEVGTLVVRDLYWPNGQAKVIEDDDMIDPRLLAANECIDVANIAMMLASALMARYEQEA